MYNKVWFEKKIYDNYYNHKISNWPKETIANVILYFGSHYLVKFVGYLDKILIYHADFRDDKQPYLIFDNPSDFAKYIEDDQLKNIKDYQYIKNWKK